jgi:hypothetical protein
MRDFKEEPLAELQPPPDAWLDRQVRVDPATGRVVLYDPGRRDGRPVGIGRGAG